VGCRKFFPQSRVLRFPDSTAAQTAIARGAAWTAAWLEAFQKPLVNPVIRKPLRCGCRDAIHPAGHRRHRHSVSGGR